MPTTRHIGSLADLAASYDVLLCDVWGVLHNGVSVWRAADDALAAFRAQGGTVVMITNAPRPAPPVIAQMQALGVTVDGPGAAFDSVVTSGDVTRALIAEGPSKVLHIGPTDDMTLYDGLDVERVAEAEAEAIVCTGPVDDAAEAPEDYLELWRRLAPRTLPMICANPDIVVERGHRLVPCAGALARDYAALGGPVRIAGKPHAPIYAEAVARAKTLRENVDPARCLAIGDGLPTDVRGAIDNGFDLLYISSGIHAADYGNPDEPDRAALDAWLAAKDAAPVATMPRLVW